MDRRAAGAAHIRLRRSVRCGRDELDLAGLQVCAEAGDLLVIEIVLDGESLQRALLDGSALLRLVEERLERYFKNGRQFSSLPF
ncbi:MAG: hypothetical protein ACRDON_12185 [Gaiellaceae bacterium]